MKLVAFATAAAFLTTTAVAEASTRCASVERSSDHPSSSRVSCAPANARARHAQLNGATYVAEAASFDATFLPASRRSAALEEVGSLPCPWCVHPTALAVGMQSGTRGARDALFDPRLRHSLGLNSLQEFPIADFDAIDTGARSPEPKFEASEAEANARPADPSPGTIAATTVMLVGLVLTRRRKSALSLRVSPNRM